MFADYKFMIKYAPSKRLILYKILTIFMVIGVIVVMPFSLIALIRWFTGSGSIGMLVTAHVALGIFGFAFVTRDDVLLEKTLTEVRERAKQLPHDEQTELQEELERSFPRFCEQIRFNEQLEEQLKNPEFRNKSIEGLQRWVLVVAVLIALCYVLLRLCL